VETSKEKCVMKTKVIVGALVVAFVVTVIGYFGVGYYNCKAEITKKDAQVTAVVAENGTLKTKVADLEKAKVDTAKASKDALDVVTKDLDACKKASEMKVVAKKGSKKAVKKAAAVAKPKK
jgi:cell division protein FtsL